MRAGLYLRVSTDSQTVENQRAPLMELAKQRGWSVKAYEETGSAVKARPVFDSLMTDARAGRLDVVAVAALDRLGRSLFDVLATVRELDRLGVAVVSLRESWLDTSGPARGLLIAVFAWVAEEERRILVERTRAGMDRARKAGKRIGRPRASSIMLGAAADLVAQGSSVRKAARAAGVSPQTLTRHLDALAARRNDER